MPPSCQLMGLGPSIWCLVEPCCKDCVTSLRQQCRLFVNSTEARPVICGRTTLERSLTSTREKEAGRPHEARLEEGELVFAYLDDVYIVVSPDRVSAIHAILQEELWRHGAFAFIMGRRKSGTGLATALLPTVWRGGGGGGEPPKHRESRNAPGSRGCCQDAARTRCGRAQRFAGGRSLQFLMSSPLGEVHVRHHEGRCDSLMKDAASLPLSMGGPGFRSPVRTSNSSFWASRADSLPVVRERHPLVADMIVDALNSDPSTPILSAVVEGSSCCPGGAISSLQVA